MKCRDSMRARATSVSKLRPHQTSSIPQRQTISTWHCSHTKDTSSYTATAIRKISYTACL